jgi:hypothetical protein
MVRSVLLALVSLLVLQSGYACSGYKITIGNKTILGCNEDAWRVTPHIWFERAIRDGQYGAAFTGSRYDGENGYAPQSGMNDVGLAFERLASYHPKSEVISDREVITNPTMYLKDILHTCKTVEEVQAYISRYDYSYFIEDVFLYVDKSGSYLVVEPYTLTLGEEPEYVISNFCPSITSPDKGNRLERYRNGVQYLDSKIDTTLEFCTALSDTMHVCRRKIGDGTLLTSIWDLNAGVVNLYFYHDYSQSVRFNLKEELEKGDRSIAVQTLFPPNKEFEDLRQYKTPKNSKLLGISIVASGGLFLFTAIFFLVTYFRKRQDRKYAFVQLMLSALGLILFYYMYVLSGSITVFYFPAPYVDPSNVFITLSSYIPFLLLGVIIPVCLMTIRLFKSDSWSIFARSLFVLNCLVCINLIGLFGYWGFYSVMHF